MHQVLQQLESVRIQVVLCAYVLHVAFWRRTGVTWTTLVRRFSDDLIIEERWGEPPWRWPWILLKHLAFNVLVILLYRYMNLTKTFIKSIGGEHARRWGSTNHLAVPLFLGLAWCVFLARPQKGGPPRPRLPPPPPAAAASRRPRSAP